MPEFFQTVMGRTFYEGTVPRIAKALERIASSLEDRDECYDDNDTSRPDCPWVVMDATHPRDNSVMVVRCTRCEYRLAMPLPVSSTFLGQMVAAMLNDHRDCTEGGRRYDAPAR